MLRFDWPQAGQPSVRPNWLRTKISYELDINSGHTLEMHSIRTVTILHQQIQFFLGHVSLDPNPVSRM